MTKINNVEIDGYRSFNNADGSVSLECWVDDSDTFKEFEEMFALAQTSTGISVVQGIRKIPVDHTEDSRLTVYCEFTTQDIHRLKDGYYLMMGFVHGANARRGYYLFTVTLHFIGTTAQYREVLKLYDLEKLSNDWSI